jgi:hypothetical protein
MSEMNSSIRGSSHWGQLYWLPRAIDFLIVSVLVSLTCCWVYRGDLSQVHPMVYKNDGLAALSRIKAYQQGETVLLGPQYVSRLNAPFSGSWSDYPSDKLTFYAAGVLSRWFGLANGSTLCVVLMQLLCALCFLGATRVIGANRGPSIVCSILFGIAPYAFFRNLNHLNLLFYGLLPLQTVALVLLMRHDTRLKSRYGWGFLLAVSFFAGLFNAYYLFWYLGFLLIAALSNLISKNWQFAMAGFAGMGAGVGGFLLQNLDTFLIRHQFGPNSMAVCRGYGDLVRLGLTLPDLFFPCSHSWSELQLVSWRLYFSKIPEIFYGESQNAYIGVVAAVAFVWMIGEGVVRIFQERTQKINPLFWIGGGVLALGLVGGVNYLIGAFGFYLLRGTNRFSILLAAISLLFLCQKLSAKRLGWWRWPLVGLLLLLGIWDQLPVSTGKPSPEHQAEIQNYLKDRELFQRMERDLPVGAMVFQLPVHFYPEHGPVHEMGDYEHFRPYLQTEHLRFSYGTIKGRNDTRWQYGIEKMPPAMMVSELEKLGFSVILINKKAYEDHAVNLINQMAQAGFHPWFDEGDFIAYRLKPSEHPELPHLGPFHAVFSGGFYSEEKDGEKTMRWCGKSGEIRIVPPFCIIRGKQAEANAGTKFSLMVAAANPKVTIYVRINGGTEQVLVSPGEGRKTIDLSVPPGGGDVRLRAKGPAAGFPGDPRHDIRFRVIDPKIHD